MARKPTFFRGIYLDWDARDPSGVINQAAATQDQWERAVVETLRQLYEYPPCQTSAAVLDGLRDSGKEVTIMPFTLKPYDTAMAGVPAKLNAGAKAEDIPAATVRGKLSDELPTEALQEIAAAPYGPERDKVRQRYEGKATGSHVRLYFTSQDWGLVTAGAGLDAADETLLHELVHALRQALGLEEPDHLLAPFPVLQGGEKGSDRQPTRPTKHSQVYDTLEEFAAIVITNIYRSENGRIGLRRDHLANADGKDSPLSAQLSNPRTFLTIWRNQLERLQRELPRVCDRIAPIQCGFNPLFELYAAQNRFAPGTRTVLARAWADPR